ncbi:helix-turn-helix domain-containing protein [Bacillus wiedmannii]|uniref:helix-turn-helix domain-containing protein n=1 Tax=Bacillus wiedmannii TaxID=1890302 RepID=UPI00077B095D|nr:helix-turn-helix domain-containing protein [Bacillus wiedmannii]KXY02665.1 hypothetical protein AT260_20840 [Bacillus wiedmannii]OAK13808.1 hypothetical protein A6281_12925 [Bacillus wiedmannii]OAK22318.1 hypothetical protein A6282_26865 [Bacillus wiedmannii]
MTTIQGTKKLAKEHIKENFERFPADIMNYVQLELITHTDVYLYMTLVRYHSEKYGYAYPSNKQLEVEMGISSKTVTISI